MKIHETTLLYEQLPSVYTLLDSTLFMWVIVLITVGIISWCLAKLWHVHSFFSTTHVSTTNNLLSSALSPAANNHKEQYPDQ